MSINLQGLSGYDFSGIVSAMVQSYSLPKVNMLQKQSALEVKKNAWKDVKTRMVSLEKTLETLRKEDTWKATKATSSNESLLSVSSSPNAIKGVYNVKVVSVAQAQTVVSGIQSIADPSDSVVTTEGSFSITVGETTKTIDVEAGASLKDIADAINNAKAGVSASIIRVENGYQLSIIANKTGEDNQAIFADEGAGTILRDLGIIDGAGILNETQKAQNAMIEVNGISGIVSATNTFSEAFPGLTLTIRGGSEGSTVTVRVEEDYSVAQKAVQAFVDQYNSVQSFIASKLKYDSATGSKGDLFGDITLQNLQERLRTLVMGNLDNPTGPYSYLSSIGITTSSDNFGISGTLVFDTEKFNKAMSENPESVANLFGAPAGGVTPKKQKGNDGGPQGLANILGQYLEPMLKYNGTIDQVDKNYADQIKDIKERISAFEDRIAAYEERLTLKYAKLESTLSALSAQSSWLTAQINAMYANKSDSK